MCYLYTIQLYTYIAATFVAFHSDKGQSLCTHRRALFDVLYLQLTPKEVRGAKFIHWIGMHVQTLPIRVLCAL